jgi:hypothetical protein
MPIPVAQSETSAIINMIERAARDPGVDLDKLQRLIEMRNSIREREAAIDFDLAMTEAQGEMRSVAADASNPQTRSKYASYAAIDRMLRPIYTKHGLSLSFNTATGAAEGSLRVLCRVAKDGYARDYQIDMPADGKGAKGGDVMTKTHATGSAVSYGMRYLLKMIFNVAVGAEDDDGNGGTRNGNGHTITDAQADEINKLLIETKSNLVLFLKRIKLESLTEIRADKFGEVMTLIRDNAKRREKQS